MILIAILITVLSIMLMLEALRQIGYGVVIATVLLIYGLRDRETG